MSAQPQSPAAWVVEGSMLAQGLLQEHLLREGRVIFTFPFFFNILPAPVPESQSSKFHKSYFHFSTWHFVNWQSSADRLLLLLFVTLQEMTNGNVKPPLGHPWNHRHTLLTQLSVNTQQVTVIVLHYFFTEIHFLSPQLAAVWQVLNKCHFSFLIFFRFVSEKENNNFIFNSLKYEWDENSKTSGGV